MEQSCDVVEPIDSESLQNLRFATPYGLRVGHFRQTGPENAELRIPDMLLKDCMLYCTPQLQAGYGHGRVRLLAGLYSTDQELVKILDDYWMQTAIPAFTRHAFSRHSHPKSLVNPLPEINFELDLYVFPVELDYSLPYVSQMLASRLEHSLVGSIRRAAMDSMHQLRTLDDAEQYESRYMNWQQRLHAVFTGIGCKREYSEDSPPHFFKPYFERGPSELSAAGEPILLPYRIQDPADLPRDRLWGRAKFSSASLCTYCYALGEGAEGLRASLVRFFAKQVTIENLPGNQE